MKGISTECMTLLAFYRPAKSGQRLNLIHFDPPRDPWKILVAAYLDSIWSASKLEASDFQTHSSLATSKSPQKKKKKKKTPPTDQRFFTSDWTITLPSHPHLRFMRAHPVNHNAWLSVASHPDNNKTPGRPCQDMVWNEERKTKEIVRFLDNWTGFQEKRNGFDVPVLNATDGRTLGNGQAHEVRPLQGNIGLELMAEARGNGVGKALFMVLLRLSNELDVEGLKVSAGTMKSNGAMRALAKGFGLVETEEVVEIPGRGVVAEVCWNDIEKEKWMDLEWVVEFTDLVLG